MAFNNMDGVLSLLIPLVGAYHHPPANLIIPLLAAGTELHLDPQPDNPYDPDAIQVWLIISLTGFDVNSIPGDALIGMGLTIDDLKVTNEIMLGFLARQYSPEHPRGPLIGNRAALDLMATPDWIAKLAFDPTGKPLVHLAVCGDDK